MNIFLLFLPIVMGYNNYYSINNSDLLVCGNKTENTLNFNWFVGENGLFRNISKFSKNISVHCPSVYFCEYDISDSNMNFHLHRMELFIVNCPILKAEAIQESLLFKDDKPKKVQLKDDIQERLQLHDAIERILNKISYHNFYLLLIIIIILLILFVIYFIIKKLDFNKFLFRRTINEN